MISELQSWAIEAIVKIFPSIPPTFTDQMCKYPLSLYVSLFFSHYLSHFLFLLPLFHAINYLLSLIVSENITDLLITLLIPIAAVIGQIVLISVVVKKLFGSQFFRSTSYQILTLLIILINIHVCLDFVTEWADSSLKSNNTHSCKHELSPLLISLKHFE